MDTPSTPSFTPEQVAMIAQQLAPHLRAATLGWTPAVAQDYRLKVTDIAERLSVEQRWVYKNWERIGGIKLNEGRGALRFNWDVVLSKVNGEPEPAATRRSTSRRRQSVAAADGYTRSGAPLVAY